MGLAVRCLLLGCTALGCTWHIGWGGCMASSARPVSMHTACGVNERVHRMSVVLVSSTGLAQRAQLCWGLLNVHAPLTATASSTTNRQL